MLGFFITVIIVYLFYYIWIIRHYDKYGNEIIKEKKKKKTKKIKKLPEEFEYFIIKYNVDMNKVNMRYFLQMIGFLIAIDFSIVISIVSLLELFINSFLIRMIILVILTILVTLISFNILGKNFKKKGLTKDV